VRGAGQQHCLFVYALIGIQMALGSCLACATVVIVPDLEYSRHDRALLDLANLQGAAHIFQQRTGRPPGSLEELVSKGILEKIPRDPWGRPYELWIITPANDARARAATPRTYPRSSPPESGTSPPPTLRTAACSTRWR
jgi:hypothetical protein